MLVRREECPGVVTGLPKGSKSASVQDLTVEL
jgi:hypothetical protein